MVDVPRRSALRATYDPDLEYMFFIGQHPSFFQARLQDCWFVVDQRTVLFWQQEPLSSNVATWDPYLVGVELDSVQEHHEHSGAVIDSFNVHFCAVMLSL